MSIATFYNYDPDSPQSIIDEYYENVGSNIFQLGEIKRAFKGSNDLIIKTADSNEIILIENTDYEIVEEDFAYTEDAGYHVYTGIRILSAEYQIGGLYITYKCVGSYTDADILNQIIDDIDELNSTGAAAIIKQHGFLSKSQCALIGSVDANGYANFLSKDGANDNVKLSATTTNVILAFANGIDEYGEKNWIAKIITDIVPPIWSGLTTDGTFYLYADLDVSDPINPIISYGISSYAWDAGDIKPATSAAGNHFYIISERKMYYDNGVSWEEKVRIYLGKVVVASNHISSVVTYSYHARYLSDIFTIASANTYTKTHNIGINKFYIRISGHVKISSNGWNTNAIIPAEFYADGSVGKGMTILNYAESLSLIYNDYLMQRPDLSGNDYLDDTANIRILCERFF